MHVNLFLFLLHFVNMCFPGADRRAIQLLNTLTDWGPCCIHRCFLLDAQI